MTWSDAPEPEFAPIPLTGWLRVVLRGLPLVGLFVLGFAVFLIMRLAERLIYGAGRPLTPLITQAVCRAALWVIGIGYRAHGTPMAQPGGVVCNHSSWLDIFALNAGQRVYFVSKAEVANWPLIGWLARAAGTVFIRRNRSDAAKQKATFQARLLAGHKLLFFPEGTSSDGARVLPFKSTLFAAFFDDALKDVSHIQPATLRYHAPAGKEASFYGWWGDMDFGPHLLQLLACWRHGSVELTLHPPMAVARFADRKALSAACEAQVRDGHKALG